MKYSHEKYWKHNIGESHEIEGKLCTYRRIKGNFRSEPYLDLVKEEQYRKALVRFRISAHRLEIETGRYAKRYCKHLNRYVKIPRNERFCSLCKKDNKIYVGDEYHALMVCSSFKTERENVLQYIRSTCYNFDYLSDYDRFIYMLNSEEPTCNMIGKFIHKIMSVTRDIPT